MSITRVARNVIGALALMSACRAQPSGPASPKTERDVITQAQMQTQHFESVYEAVQALRGNWLAVRGPSSLAAPSQVWVYFDGTRLGGPEALRMVSPIGVSYARFYDGIAATGRWGVGHGQGVIYLSSYPR